MAQVSLWAKNMGSVQRWVNSESLGFSSLKLEWDIYVQGLKHYGIYLNQEEDTLAWSQDNGNGQVSMKLAYQSIFFLIPLKMIAGGIRSYGSGVLPSKQDYSYGWIQQIKCLLGTISRKVEGLALIFVSFVYLKEKVLTIYLYTSP